ncbi:MAG TPA: hypothetical protein EYQ24_07400 [Bacteroidetes bacterium]|nr:hypothetical protein [Bacteroidota bacterium]
MPSPDDSWDAPPDGLIRGLMDRHGLTREQAVRRVGLEPDVVREHANDLGLVPFRALPDGARFRLHGTLFYKRLPRIATGARRPVDPEYDYDVDLPERKRRPNARSVEPVSGHRHRLAYVRPEHAVEPAPGRGGRSR